MPSSTSRPRRTRATAAHYFPMPRWHVMFSEAGSARPQPRRGSTDVGAEALKILIVEDEHLVAQATSLILKQAGYQPVDIAASGADAVRLALQLLPDVVLMDIRLREPQPDGIHAALEIRKNLDCAIIFVTAHRDAETMARAEEASPDGFLSKPYSSAQLNVLIDSAIAKRRGQPPADTNGDP